VLTVLASPRLKGVEIAANQSALIQVSPGLELEAELKIENSRAVAHLSLSQLKPSSGWTDAACFDANRLERSAGLARHRFRPTARGLYMLDWYAYLDASDYVLRVHVTSAGTRMYSRVVTAGGVPNMNPRGVIAVSVG
jgi:hypothetical protein